MVLSRFEALWLARAWNLRANGGRPNPVLGGYVAYNGALRSEEHRNACIAFLRDVCGPMADASGQPEQDHADLQALLAFFRTEEIVLAYRFIETLRHKLTAYGLPDSAFEFDVTCCLGNQNGPYSGRRDCAYIDQITVTDHGQGIGGRLMRACLELADEMGVTLLLEPASQKFDEQDPWWKENLSPEKIAKQAWRFEVLSQEELEEWYRHLGFAEVDGCEGMMARAPGTPIGAPRRHLQRPTNS